MNDDVACAETAAEHLLERGFSTGYLGHRGFIWSDVRREHFQQKLAEWQSWCAGSPVKAPAGSWYQRRHRQADRRFAKPVGILAVTMLARTILEVAENWPIPEQLL